MIHVSQGHEKSISLEVFLKSCLCLSNKNLKNITLHVFKDSLIQNLNNLNLKFSISNNLLKIGHKNINLKILDVCYNTQTMDALISAIGSCKNIDILLTLPSSKDQFIYNKKIYSGHTEFFRHFFNSSNLAMTFIGPNNNLTLLTDHVPLNTVTTHINKNLIITKIEHILNSPYKLVNIQKIYFSGINPHCGEDGLLGNDEKHINQAIEYLKDKYKNISFYGPISGDTIFFNKFNSNDLVVFAHHDQGLAPFKSQNGLLGINTTYGLPFLRVSPDHGTAFDLYGKDKASYQGLLFVLNKILK